MKKGLVVITVIAVLIVLVALLVIHHRDKMDSAAVGATGTVSSFFTDTGGSPSSVSPAASTDTGSAPAPATTASSLTAGTYNGSIVTTDGRTRTYIIHIPSGYNSNKSYPLVLVFHGGEGTGAKVEASTDFDTKADGNGFIVVYPDSVGAQWNDGRGTTPEQQQGVNDVSFVQQLITRLESQLPINTDRIYATGESNGGMLTELLGCDLPNVFAAIGTDVGPIATPVAAQCHPGAIPVVGIQGGADPIVPINGGNVKSSAILGAGGLVESAAFTMNLWATADSCNVTPTITHIPPTVNDGTSVDEYSYSGCTSGTTVTYYIVQGMGHAWPPASGQLPRITGATSQNINATDVMWTFFSQHSK